MMGLGSDDGKMEPALGRPGWVIAEKERIETISFSVQPGPNKGAGPRSPALCAATACSANLTRPLLDATHG
jgi:hypothetical protein